LILVGVGESTPTKIKGFLGFILDSKRNVYGIVVFGKGASRILQICLEEGAIALAQSINDLFIAFTYSE
jgi:hypothetical protein